EAIIVSPIDLTSDRSCPAESSRKEAIVSDAGDDVARDRRCGKTRHVTIFKADIDRASGARDGGELPRRRVVLKVHLVLLAESIEPKVDEVHPAIEIVLKRHRIADGRRVALDAS